MLVFDATPLIYLATVNRLDVLDVIDEERVVPRPVYEEVVTAGLEAGHPDARRVERAVDDGLLSVRSDVDSGLAERLRDNPNLSAADVAVIAMAAAEDGIAVMDDRYGRAVTNTEGVDTRGTAWLLASGIRTGQLSGDEAVGILDDIIEAGWYCSTDLYMRIIEEFRTLASHG